MMPAIACAEICYRLTSSRRYPFDGVRQAWLAKAPHRDARMIQGQQLTPLTCPSVLFSLSVAPHRRISHRGMELRIDSDTTIAHVIYTYNIYVLHHPMFTFTVHALTRGSPYHHHCSSDQHRTHIDVRTSLPHAHVLSSYQFQ